MHSLLRKSLILLLLLASPTLVFAHCQVPCGIYDDEARITQMREDITTIEKAFSQIESLSGKSDAVSVQQVVRWVNAKEDHAQKIMDTLSAYFLAQRVKAPAEEKDQAAYATSLKKHHRLLVASMKAKQFAGADSTALVKELNDALTAVAALYEHKH